MPATSSNAFGQVFAATYDILDRVTNSVNANGVVITNSYDNLHRPLVRGYPDGGTEQFGYTLDVAGVTSYINQLGSNVMTYAYDPAGRKTNEVGVGVYTNTFSYWPAGDLYWIKDGKGQYTTFAYDQYGRMTQDWDDNDSSRFILSYNANGWLTNRWTPGKTNTAYEYNAVGNLTDIDYEVSPDISFEYDELSRLTSMTDSSGTTSYTYEDQFLAGEDGPWASDTVSYSYTNRLRSGLSVQHPSATAWAQGYEYDAASRLQTITSPAGTFTYDYSLGVQEELTNASGLIKKLTLPGGSYVTNTFDSIGRLTGTWLKNSASTTRNSHAYGYNAANQRIAATNFAGNYLDYTYDNVGQLKTAKGKESGGSSRLHEQFGYEYDAAANLKRRTNNAFVQAFNVDNVNQLTSGSRSGTLTVAGTTSAAATNVTVNTQAATRYGDNTFAKAGFSVANGNNTFTAIAQDSYGRKDTNVVTAYLPSSPAFTHDANGNLISDGKRGFEYDDENQLVRVTVTNTWKSEFTYDGKMRQRVRKEYRWGGGWILTNEVRYVYDGNVVIQERDGSNLPVVTYTRAGAGLLARSDQTASPAVHAYYHRDGNLNITCLVSTNGIVVARYQYDPFGNTLAKSGPLADVNLYRFSSKELHVNSGLIYYGRRFYEPNLQRWITRDPLGEAGGINLYSFVGNNPIDRFDLYGLFTIGEWVSISGSFLAGAGEGLVNEVVGVAKTAKALTFDLGRQITLTGFDIVEAHHGAENFDSAIFKNYYSQVLEGQTDPQITGELALQLSGYRFGNEIFNSLDCGDYDAFSEQMGQFGLMTLGTARGLKGPAKGTPTPRLPGPTVDPLTGQPVGRFIGNQSGPAMIEPVGGRTVSAGRGGVDTHTLYPNGANYQRLNPVGHPNNPTPHAHGHAPGTGPGMRGQGPSLDTSGNVVPWNSPGAHWPFP